MATKLDITKTLEQAKQLEQLAGDMQNQMVKKLAEICTNIEASWSGEAGKAYLTYMRGVQTDMQNKISHIKNTAEFLRTTAKEMSAADNAAQSSLAKM